MIVMDAPQPLAEPPTAPEPVAASNEDENPYLQYLKSGTALSSGRPLLGERFSAHEVNAEVRGQVLGALRQFGGSQIEKAARERGQVAELENDAISLAIRNRETLAQYDMMPGAEGFLERSVAVLGSLYGGVKSPESLIGNVTALPKLAAHGLWGRLAETGINQAVIAGGANLGAQAINLATPGVREHFDMAEAVLSAGAGFVIGAGIRGAVEGASLFVKPQVEKDAFNFLKLMRDEGGPEEAKLWPQVYDHVQGKSDDELRSVAKDIGKLDTEAQKKGSKKEPEAPSGETAPTEPPAPDLSAIEQILKRATDEMQRQRVAGKPDAATELHDHLGDMLKRGEEKPKAADDVLDLTPDMVAPDATPQNVNLTLQRDATNDHLGHEFFNIKDAEGETVGSLNINTQKKGVLDVSIDSDAGPNAFGPAAMRDLLRQVKEAYPDAEIMTGSRGSGARAEAGHAGDTAEIRLRDRSDAPLEGEIITPEQVKVQAEVREMLADGYMDATGGQSPLDVAISTTRELISQGETHSPDGAPWAEVLRALEARQGTPKRDLLGGLMVDQAAERAARGEGGTRPVAAASDDAVRGMAPPERTRDLLGKLIADLEAEANVRNYPDVQRAIAGGSNKSLLQVVSEHIGLDEKIAAARDAVEPYMVRAANLLLQRWFQMPIDNAKDLALLARLIGVQYQVSEERVVNALLNMRSRSPATPIGEQLAAAAEGDAVRGMAVRQAEGSAPRNLPAQNPVPAAGSTPIPAPNIRAMWQEFAEATGAIVRQGRMTLKGAAGEFDLRSGAIRMKQIDDPVVLAHEIGHHLDENIPKLKALSVVHASELERITQYASGQKTPDARRAEGLAEYLRLFAENPAEAAKRAPVFDVEFRKLLDTQPELKAAYETIQKQFDAYRAADPSDIVRANVANPERPSNWEKLREDIRDRGFWDTIMSRGSEVYTGLVDETNPLAVSVRELLKLQKQKTGQLLDFPTASDPYKLIRLARLAHQAGMVDLARGVAPYHSISSEGSGLFEAIALATGKPNVLSGWDEKGVNDFASYLISRRAVFEWERRAQGLLDKDPTPFEKSFYERDILRYEAENPNAKAAADMVYDWTRNLLRKEYEAGLITRQAYDEALKIRDYVPFMRDLSERTGDVPGGGRGGVDIAQGAGLSQFKGSSRPILNPLHSLMERAFNTAELIAYNDAIRALANLADLAGVGSARWVERVPAQEMRARYVDPLEALKKSAEDAGMSSADANLMVSGITQQLQANGQSLGPVALFRPEQARARGENLVFFMEGGEMKALRLPEGEPGQQLADILTNNLHSPMRDWNLSALGFMAKALRLGVTSSPSFFLNNIVRDQTVAWILNRGTLPFFDAGKGLQRALTSHEFADIYSRFGGLAGGVNVGAVNEELARRSLQDLAKKGMTVSRLASWEALFKAVELSETGTRLGIFENAFVAGRKQGLTDYQAALEATFRAVDYIDFGRHGSRTAATMALVPFFNANIQGVDKAGRALLSPFFREALTKGDAQARTDALVSFGKLSSLTGLSMALRAMYVNDPEYDEISDYLRRTHWMVRVPGLKSGKVVGIDGSEKDLPAGVTGLWVAIPKPFEMSIPMNLGERAVEVLSGKDPKALSKWLHSVPDLLGMDRGIWEATGAKLGYEVWGGKNFFTGRDIVPDNLKGVEPWLQATAGTSAFSKAAAERLDRISKAITGEPSKLSPMILDHIIRGTFGTWGRDLLTMSDQAFGTKGERSLAQTAVAMRNFKEAYSGSTSLDEFWKTVGRENGDFLQAAKTYDALLKAGVPSQAADYAAKLDDGKRVYVTLAMSPLDDAREDLKKINKREKIFSPGEMNGDAVFKRSHPLFRAELAVNAIGQMTREIANGRLVSAADPNEVIKLSPSEQRVALDILSRVRMWEARNALIASERKGMTGMNVVDTKDDMEILRHAVPAAYDELAQRYANAKVYRFDAVRAAWPTLKSEVMQNGSNADLARVVADIAKDGFELGDTRDKGKRVRPPLPGRPAAVAAPPAP